MSIIQSIVESVVGKLGETLIQPLLGEAILLHGVRDQVRRLKDEFAAMTSFLEDADGKQLVDKRVKNWVRQVRAVACEAEDAIDIYAYKIAPLRQRGFVGKLKRYALISTELKALHDLGRKIEPINSKIIEIANRRERYGIQRIPIGGDATGSEIQSLRRICSPHVSEPDFVDLREKLQSLVEELIKGERRRCVVSLIGMGGVGKTTLARKAYNHGAVVSRFSLRAWVSISQQYSVRELLLDIAKKWSVSLVEELQSMNEVDLSGKIFDFLKNKTYLVVMDDVWESNAWDDLKDAFPDESNGSRMLLTTRNNQVALYADGGNKAYELPLLNEDESWQLFCKKAFPRQENGCGPDLELIAREIVNKCGGLPLAILVIGGLLLTKRKEAREWQKVLESFRWQFRKEDNPVFQILSLSYNHLPYALKPCFLYLAIFPEDYEFPAETLIRLWVAEGFLQQRGQETPEEVGEDILTELISRNLIQVAETNSAGLIESCRMHDLVRDLCVRKAKEDEFVEEEGWGSAPNACKGRRLAVHGVESRPCTCLDSTIGQHLRSVFFFSKETSTAQLQRGQEQLLLRRFKMLRVLDLDVVYISELPIEIGKLVHLRYLRCSNTNIKSLPLSMTNLHNLQTLEVHGCQQGLHIPGAIMKMLQRLRNLQLLSAFQNYENFEDLKPVLSSNLFDILPKDPSYRYVGYAERIELENTNQSSLISNLSLIDKSFIPNSSSSMPPPLRRPLLTSCHLHLYGSWSKLPDPCDFPRNISELRLRSSGLEIDPLPLLEKLENLRILALEMYSYTGTGMTCSAGGFPHLQSLYLIGLPYLERWTVEAGSMPCLSYLLIKYCVLKMVPEGLKYLRNLKKLEIQYLPSEFVNKIRPQEGEDWHKVQHIPSIEIDD